MKDWIGFKLVKYKDKIYWARYCYWRKVCRIALYTQLKTRNPVSYSRHKLTGELYSIPGYFLTYVRNAYPIERFKLK